MSFHQLYLKNIYYYIVVRKAMPPTLSKKYLLLVRKAMPPTLSKKYQETCTKFDIYGFD
jgi:hypothetical protein